jgi:phage recombination protein Bet
MSNAVATIPTERRSVLMTMAGKYNMEPAPFEQTLRGTVFPAAGTREQFAAFLIVANQYGLNPVTKEIYAFPAKGGGIVPIVSIDGWLNIINSHPQLNGIEFDDHVDGAKVTAITCRLWRKDREKPIVVTEYLAECEKSTEPWQKWPRRMLRHKALIQCARYAFGFAGIVDPDEAERMGVDASPMRTVRQDDGPPPPPVVASPSIAIEHQQPAAEPEAERSMAALYEDSAPAGEVVWEDAAEDGPPAPTKDGLDLPEFLDRRTAATAADVFDATQWIKDCDGAFAGAEDMITLGEAWVRLAKPHEKQAFPPDWSKVVASYKKHASRIGRSNLDAG